MQISKEERGFLNLVLDSYLKGHGLENAVPAVNMAIRLKKDQEQEDELANRPTDSVGGNGKIEEKKAVLPKEPVEIATKVHDGSTV